MRDVSKTKLSELVRPDCEAAPWVIEEIKRLETENAKLRAELERRVVPDDLLARCADWCDGNPKQPWYGRTAGDMVRTFMACQPLCAPSAPKADDPVKVQGEDTARLDFMLSRHRKVVVERLPHDNFEVYVEEGFMGDKRHPGVLYSGEWGQGTPEALEIQREAIDAAIAAARKGEGE